MVGLTLSIAPEAHIGSPDVFVDAQAGPYRVYVTVRPPHAIPGVAQVEVLASSDDVQEVRIVPLPLTGPGAKFAPVSDVATRSADDPRFFTGTLWMMTAGAWQVRVNVTGARGSGQVAVPVPTLPQATLEMTPALGALLAGLMLLLCAGLVAIIVAAVRDAGLEPGELPLSDRRRRGRIAGVIATVIVAAVVYFGNLWWGAEAANYAGYVYKPLTVTPTLTNNTLRLQLADPGWLRSRTLDDFVPDHGHPMHLFIVTPALDRLLHLHPREVAAGLFEQTLPDLPAGRYELFADLVHATGVSETVTASFETAAIHGAPLSGDDSAWDSAAKEGTIGWIDQQRQMVPKRLNTFSFVAQDQSGRPADDVELYMGMPGHAVFIRRDRQVFAHVHPSGSAPMAALAMASAAAPVHGHPGAQLPPTVTFPYGFPEPGDYRIFVQMKRSGRIVTGSFDVRVD